MEVKNIIVHLLEKEQQAHGRIELGLNPLTVGPKEIEFITNLKTNYYKKSNPNYGIFDPDMVSYPFQALLKDYLEGRSDFYEFTVSAMNNF